LVFFAVFFILNTKKFENYSKDKLRSLSSGLLYFVVEIECIWIGVGWYWVIRSDCNISPDNLSISILGSLLTASFFNTLFCVLLVFVVLTGHPLEKTIAGQKSQESSKKKFIFFKFCLFFSLFAFPDLNILSKYWLFYEHQ
jgi:hypothetical protein